MWMELKEYIALCTPNANDASLYVCQYCRPLLNSNKLPCRCVLNGLEAEPVPPELTNLDHLSKQLIQRAKGAVGHIHKPTIHFKLAREFFLPLPLTKQLRDC